MKNFVLFLATQAITTSDEPFLIADYIKTQFEKQDKSWLGQKDWICQAGKTWAAFTVPPKSTNTFILFKIGDLHVSLYRKI